MKDICQPINIKSTFRQHLSTQKVPDGLVFAEKYIKNEPDYGDIKKDANLKVPILPQNLLSNL